MTVSRIFLSAACVLAFACPAEAQMYPGQGVAVNPAATSGTGVVVYRGGAYVRLPPLLQPGQPFPGTQGEPIQLHMPEQHKHRVVRKEQPPQEDVATAPAPQPAAESAAPAMTAMPLPAKPVARVVKQEMPPPADTAADTTPVNASPDDGATAVPFSFGGPRQQRAAPARQPALQPQSPRAEAPRTEVRHPSRAVAAEETIPTETITHAPATTQASVQPSAQAPVQMSAQAPMTPGEEPANLSKRSEILFPHNGTDPSTQTLSQLKQLAGVLNSALDAGARRVQLDAFGGAPGDKSSDARRVSLKRALVIRQLLIDDGVPASRIDVRAMGGIDDNGNADRVDVYVRAG